MTAPPDRLSVSCNVAHHKICAVPIPHTICRAGTDVKGHAVMLMRCSHALTLLTLRPAALRRATRQMRA